MYGNYPCLRHDFHWLWTRERALKQQRHTISCLKRLFLSFRQNERNYNSITPHQPATVSTLHTDVQQQHQQQPAAKVSDFKKCKNDTYLACNIHVFLILFNFLYFFLFNKEIETAENKDKKNERPKMNLWYAIKNSLIDLFRL